MKEIIIGILDIMTIITTIILYNANSKSDIMVKHQN